MADARKDRSNGYDRFAEVFIRARNPRIGVATVAGWAQALKPGTEVLDLGCGHGVPISQALIEAGFRVCGVDASAKLVEAFRNRFPQAEVECAPAEESEFFGRGFDAILAWGLFFLLTAETQALLIGKVARALNPGGKFLFTSPREAITWPDALTERPSVSLGFEKYHRLLGAGNLVLDGEGSDEGENHYYFASKPST